MLRYDNAISDVMEHERFMLAADWIELREIEAAVADAKLRRKRLFNRLRQRAHRDRQGR